MAPDTWTHHYSLKGTRKAGYFVVRVDVKNSQKQGEKIVGDHIQEFEDAIAERDRLNGQKNEAGSDPDSDEDTEDSKR